MHELGDGKDTSPPKQDCERCLEGLGSKKTQAVGQYFINFTKLQWLCKACIKTLVRFYGKDIRERERFEKQIRALIDCKEVKGDTFKEALVQNKEGGSNV